jgi:energy-coupling factor transporter ATP-binding protein EcfA2
VLRPRLLLLDEPLADLDESGIECVRQGLVQLTGSTLLIASPTTLSAELVDRCFPMSGEIPQC